jgi:hypothetical protein
VPAASKPPARPKAVTVKPVAPKKPTAPKPPAAPPKAPAASSA